MPRSRSFHSVSCPMPCRCRGMYRCRRVGIRIPSPCASSPRNSPRILGVNGKARCPQAPLCHLLVARNNKQTPKSSLLSQNKRKRLREQKKKKIAKKEEEGSPREL